MLKLTSLSSCAGCAAKLPQHALTEVLHDLPQFKNPNLLVGSATADDAGVFRIDRARALVQTVDFFTPIVDDPFWFGQIAATNAISDIYAMGGRPLTSLNLLGIPADKVGPAMVKQILRVGVELAEEKLIRAAVDITGFGLLGHLASMCLSSNVSAEISFGAVPAIDREIFSLIERECVPGGSRQNLETANQRVDWNSTPQNHRVLLTDAQTSGGLLLCVPQKSLARVLQVLKRNRTAAQAIIGRITRCGDPLIRVVA